MLIFNAIINTCMANSSLAFGTFWNFVPKYFHEQLVEFEESAHVEDWTVSW